MKLKYKNPPHTINKHSICKTIPCKNPHETQNTKNQNEVQSLNQQKDAIFTAKKCKLYIRTPNNLNALIKNRVGCLK